jgi:hypothetical protein
LPHLQAISNRNGQQPRTPLPMGVACTLWSFWSSDVREENGSCYILTFIYMYHGRPLDSSACMQWTQQQATRLMSCGHVLCLHMEHKQIACISRLGVLECPNARHGSHAVYMLRVTDAKLWSAVQEGAKACAVFVPLFVSTAPSVKTRLGKLPWLLCVFDSKLVPTTMWTKQICIV